MADLPMLHLILCDQESVNDGLCHPRVHPGHPHVSLTTITRREGWGGGAGWRGCGVVRCTGLLQVVLEGDAVPHILLG